VALVSHLLAFGGSSASSLEAQQAGLWAAGIATAVSGKSGPLMELSPAGGEGRREVKQRQQQQLAAQHLALWLLTHHVT
jgi:hypothetical protein